MLSPVINNTMDLLTQAFNEILQLDGFATTSGNIIVGKLPNDPTWLPSVRNRIGMLANAGAAWTHDKPDIWGAVLLQFTDYAACVAGVAAQQSKVTTSAQWIDLLQSVLLPQLAQAISATQQATNALEKDHDAFKDIEPLLSDSIDQGWAALSDEEQEMTQIASQLTHLQDLVQSLQGGITSSEISSGKSVISTTVTLLYKIATQTAGSFSFLSMATSAYTVGKMYYDLISQTDEIADTLQQIATLQLEASEEAQAAAGTKLVLQMLYNVEESFNTIGDVLPQIATLWRTEQEKVQSVVEALQANVNPSTYFELATLGVANRNWQAINTFAMSLASAKNIAGQPVTLDPQAPSLATTVSS